MDNKNSDNVLEICATYTEKVQQKQDINNERPNCFILPFIFGDKTDYFGQEILEKVKFRYGNIECYYFKNIKEGESSDDFSSKLLSDIREIKSGMSNGIYPNTDTFYIPVIIMLSSKFTSNIDEYLNKIISDIKDDYKVKMDIYFVVDKYGEEIVQNKKEAVSKVNEYIENKEIEFGEIYFLGESNFIFSEKPLKVAVDTIETNIFYKVTRNIKFNWRASIDELNAQKEDYSGVGLENLDCNWVSIGYIKFDLCKYLILYYLKQFIEIQIGKNQEDVENAIEPSLADIKQIEDEIDSYLEKKYPVDNLIRHIRDIPIHSAKIPYIKSEKKGFFGNLFKKNTSNAAFSFDNLEERLFGDRDYFIKYIELNSNEEIGEFDLKSKISSFNLVNKLDKILNQLKISTNKKLDEVTNKLNMEKGFLNKTDDLSSFMGECNNRYLKIKLERYVLNKKFELIEKELEKNKDTQNIDLDTCKQNKEKTLVVINNLMEKTTFNNYNFKHMIDGFIEDQNSQKIFKNIPWSISFNKAVQSIGEDKFIDLLYSTLDGIYRDNIDRLSLEFENAMNTEVRNKYCIKYLSGYAAGDAINKPAPIVNKNKMYCDYFEAIMCGSTSDIKFE